MLIKSNRYLCMESGDGETMIERDRANNNFLSFLSCTNDRNVVDVLLNTITCSIPIARDYHSMCEKWVSLSERIKRYRNSAIKKAGQKLVVNKSVITEEDLEYEIYTLSPDDCGLIKAMRRDAAEIVEKYDKLFDKYKIHCKDILEKIDGFSDIFESQMRNWDEDEDAPKTFTTKELLYKELKYTVDTQKNLSSVVEMDEWSDSIAIENAIRVKDNTNLDIKSILKTAALEATGLADFKKLNDERAWSDREKGAILISDDKRNFFKIGTDGNLKKCVLRDYDKFIVETINSIND